MNHTDITPEFVRGLWNHLRKAHGSRVLDKSKAPLMRMAGRIVERRTDMSREEFANSAVTTLGRRIFVPFEPGVPSPGWDLGDQLLLGPHEHQHVVQWKKQPLRFWVRYARDTRARALYEAEAFVTEFETLHIFGLVLEPWTPALRVGTLASYGVEASDIEAAHTYVDNYVRPDGTLRKGVTTKVGVGLAKWFIP